MDVYFQLDGILFVWANDKAALNLVKHGVRFENAAEVFLDPMLDYVDASVDGESRVAAIGRTFHWRLLFVVHVEREDDGCIRIISARDVTARENAAYQTWRDEL